LFTAEVAYRAHRIEQLGMWWGIGRRPRGFELFAQAHHELANLLGFALFCSSLEEGGDLEGTSMIIPCSNARQLVRTIPAPG
jgi:hypothetical protein